MAVTRFDGCIELTAANDVASPRTGYAGIVINALHIIKSTAGDVTIRDSQDNDILYTLADNENFILTFPNGGWKVGSLEYQAVSAGTAVIVIFGTDAATF